MRRFPIVVCAVLFACSSAQAISRVNSKTLSCSKARALVKSEGAVIYRFPSKNNPGMTLFDRFVAHRGHCAFGEVAVPREVPTKTGECAMLVCVQNQDDGGGFRRKKLENFGNFGANDG